MWTDAHANLFREYWPRWQPTLGQVSLYVDEFEGTDESILLAAITRAAKTMKFIPKPVELRKHVREVAEEKRSPSSGGERRKWYMLSWLDFSNPIYFDSESGINRGFSNSTIMTCDKRQALEAGDRLNADVIEHWSDPEQGLQSEKIRFGVTNPLAKKPVVKVGEIPPNPKESLTEDLRALQATCQPQTFTL